MTGKELRERYSTEDIELHCSVIAQEITMREYVDGNSKDVTRATSEIEAEIIKKICIAAIDAFCYASYQDDGIFSMAEFMLMQFFGVGMVNAYDTIYVPLRKFTETGAWRKRS